jgi:hypothetical protein
LAAVVHSADDAWLPGRLLGEDYVHDIEVVFSLLGGDVVIVKAERPVNAAEEGPEGWDPFGLEMG